MQMPQIQFGPESEFMCKMFVQWTHGGRISFVKNAVLLSFQRADHSWRIQLGALIRNADMPSCFFSLNLKSKTHIQQISSSPDLCAIHFESMISITLHYSNCGFVRSKDVQCETSTQNGFVPKSTFGSIDNNVFRI